VLVCQISAQIIYCFVKCLSKLSDSLVSFVIKIFFRRGRGEREKEIMRNCSINDIIWYCLDSY